MTKTEFLKHLDKRLQVLKQQEREDILGEYDQHIELKMGNGLSEEEAIRDFGDLEELAEEILDAYNVDPLYGKEEKRPSLVSMEELGDKAGAAGRKAASGLKAAGKGAWHLLGLVWEAVKSFGIALWHLLCRLGAGLKHGCFVMVHWLPFGDRVMTEDGETVKDRKPLLELVRANREKQANRETEVQERSDLNMWSKICNGGRAIGRWLVRLVYFCIRLCVLLFVLAPVAVGDCLALVGLGVLVVMVLQGYPLIGVTIMTFGTLACGVSFVWFIWNLMFGGKKEEGEKVWESENI